MSAECNKCGRVMYEHGDKEHCSGCYTEILEKKLKVAIEALQSCRNYCMYSGKVDRASRQALEEIKEGE